METISKFINPWLQQRQEILVGLNNLARLLPCPVAEDPVSLSTFFQTLIDYTCKGHLQIFALLLQCNRTQHFASIKQTLQQINNTTNCIIKFNDKYNKFKNISVNDITVLLEQFASRIELEDLLLNISTSAPDKNYIN